MLKLEIISQLHIFKTIPSWFST